MYQTFFDEEEAVRREGRQADEAKRAKETQAENSAASRRDQTKLDGLWDAVNDEAHPAFQMKVKHDDRKDRHLKVIRQNSYLDTGNLPDMLNKLLVLICTYPPAWVIDVFILASTTAAFVGMTMGEVSGTFMFVAKLVFPTALILLETGIALRRFKAIERRQAGRARIWTGAGVVLVVYLLCAAAATYIASQEDIEFASVFDIIWMILLGIAFVSVAGLLHVVILLSGNDVFEGKTYAFFLFRRWRVTRLARKYRTLAKETLRPCLIAVRASRVFKQTHGVMPEPPLLSAAARIVINDAMGQEVVPQARAAPHFSVPTPSGNGVS